MSQPIFDRHCVGCHSGLKPAGGLDFSGGLTCGWPRGRTRNVAYDTIFAHKSHRPLQRLRRRADHHAAGLRFAPQQAGRGPAKRDMQQAGETFPEEWLRLITWIDLNGPYHDRFINKRRNGPPTTCPPTGN